MEELRSAVIKLQKNFRELVETDNAIKDGINCNSKNLEALKNLTLDINQRVKVLEDTLEKKKSLNDNDIVNVKNDLRNLNSKIDGVEEKLVDDMTGTVKHFETTISQSNKNHDRDKIKLQELLEDNERKMKEVVKNFNFQKKKVNNQEKPFKCEECGEIIGRKRDLKIHIRINHPKFITCDFCDEMFKESWQYEKHLESHTKSKDKKCDVCDKRFFLDWRLKQHMNIHNNPHVKNCHYYNNQKECPYDAIGCKFNHKISQECKRQGDCKIKLCPLQHRKIPNKT